MKKMMNSAQTLITDELQGYAKIHKDKIRLLEGTTCIVRAEPKEKGKVKLVMGNGGGHEPAVIGWVGSGMFDMNIVGDVMTAPSGDKMLKALEDFDDGSPILLMVQNHAGDVMNANIAYAKAKKKGMDMHKVVFYDDIASAPKECIEERRGMAGMYFYTKIVGAMAENGATAEECVAMFDKVRDNTRTYAVAFTSCTHPATGLPMFDYLENNNLIELGMGIHGEGGGGNRVEMPTAAELAAIMGKILLEDKPYAKGDKLLAIVNGAGSTTCMEMSIFYNELEKYLTAEGMEVVDAEAGNFLTTQELGGVSVSLCSVDEDMLQLWNAPCDCAIITKK